MGVRLGVSQKPLNTLACAFVTKELAQKFIEHQHIISKKKYKLKENVEN